MKMRISEAEERREESMRRNGEVLASLASVHQNPYLSNPFVAKNRILYFRARLIRIYF